MKTLIVCCDNRGGMMFNNRRCSMDSTLNEKLVSKFKKEKFFVLGYSKDLFPNGIVFENWEEDGVYFVEDPDFLPENLESVFEQIVLVKWNRDYPFDKSFPNNLQCYRLRSIVEFEGYSHETISMNFYRKREGM